MRSSIIANLFNGKNFCDCISKMEPDHLREDLKQEVILIICELPEEKLLQLHADKALEFFTVRVILNQIKSKTSPFYKKYRQYQQGWADYLNDKQVNDELISGELTTDKSLRIKNQLQAEIIYNTEIEERELREMIEDMAIEEIDKLHWYNKGLVELYLKHGNFRAIEKETGIPFGSCYKTIKKSFNQIKETVNKPIFTKEELKFIQNNKQW